MKSFVVCNLQFIYIYIYTEEYTLHIYIYIYIYIYIIPMIKSRRMIQTGHVARMGGRKGTCRLLAGNPEE
jgi:hypothetical protein